MRGRDSDSQRFGPVPEHERTWRHPAEVAAEAAARKNDPSTSPAAPPTTPSSAPPLRRRTTAAVAAASVAASIVLLAVALPSEIERRDSPTADDAALIGAVKGSRPAPHVIVDGRAVSVVTVGDGLLVTSTAEVSAASSITISGSTIDVELVGSDPETGISLLSAPGWTDDDVLASIPAEVVTDHTMITVHADGSTIPCHPSLELAARSTTERALIATDAPIDGASIVSDSMGTPLGVAVATDSGTWMHSRTGVERALSRVTAAG